VKALAQIDVIDEYTMTISRGKILAVMAAPGLTGLAENFPRLVAISK